VRSNRSQRCPSESSTWPTLPFQLDHGQLGQGDDLDLDPEPGLEQSVQIVQDGLDVVTPRPGVAVVHVTHVVEGGEREHVGDGSSVGRELEPSLPLGIVTGCTQLLHHDRRHARVDQEPHPTGRKGSSRSRTASAA
jgi:hypothetical protein